MSNRKFCANRTVSGVVSMNFVGHVQVLDYSVVQQSDSDRVAVAICNVDFDEQQQHQDQRYNDQTGQQTIVVKHEQNEHHTRRVRDDKYFIWIEMGNGKIKLRTT